MWEYIRIKGNRKMDGYIQNIQEKVLKKIIDRNTWAAGEYVRIHGKTKEYMEIRGVYIIKKVFSAVTARCCF